MLPMNQMTKFSDNKPLGLFHYTHFHFFDHPIVKNDVYFFECGFISWNRTLILQITGESFTNTSCL